MKLEFDLNECVKSGQCVYLFPELVRVRPDGFPECTVDHLGLAQKERAEELVETCPVMAITLIQD